jgi:hypothetical protein
MCLLEDVGVGAFGVYNNLIVFACIPNDHTHPLSTSERNNLNQLINYLLLLKFNLNEVFGLLYEAVSDEVSKTYETHLIRTRTLKLVFGLVLYYIMTYN